MKDLSAYKLGTFRTSADGQQHLSIPCSSKEIQREYPEQNFSSSSADNSLGIKNTLDRNEEKAAPSV